VLNSTSAQVGARRAPRFIRFASRAVPQSWTAGWRRARGARSPKVRSALWRWPASSRSRRRPCNSS